MKSFKNHYNRSKFLPTLKNLSFESPALTTNSFVYYNDFNQVQKDSFIWIGGGNNLNSMGPPLVNGVLFWTFASPFPSGNQCVAIQSNSFIQQSVYLASGTYTLSFMYCSRSASNINPISIIIDDIVIGTSPNVATNVWTVFNQSFNISQNRTIVLKLLGTSLLDQTTAIDNITIS